MTRSVSAGTPLPSSVVSLAAAVAASVVTAVSAYALAASVAGLVLLGVGVVRASSRAFTAGTGLLFAAVVVAGMLGMAPVYLLVAAFFVLSSWEAGQYGFGVAAEVGHDAPTRRIELVHLLGSTVVLVAGASVGFGAFLATTGGKPALALLALLVGTVAFLVALRA